MRNSALCTIILIAVTLLGCVSPSQKQPEEYQGEVLITGGTRSFRGSTLDESGPVPVLSLSGTAYERGLAYGVLMFDEFRAYQEPMESYMKAGKKLMPFYMRLFSTPYLNSRIRHFLKVSPQAYVDEMQGMADGLGGTLKQIALYTYFPYIRSGCTSVLSLSSDANSLIHGRNWDYEPYLMGERPVLIHFTAESGIHVYTVTSLGAPMFHGCNDRGISISINTMDTNSASTDGMPVCWRLRQVLENAATLDEVDSIMTKGENDHGHWLVTVGSAREKDGRVYNLINKVQSYEEMTDHKPAVVLNRPYYVNGADNPELRANTDFFTMIREDNINRQLQADTFLAKHEINTATDMWQLLRNHDLTEQGMWLNRGSIANYATMFSVVFDLSHRTFSFAAAPSWSSLRTVWEYSISDGSFRQLLPEDDYCKTSGFLRNERAYLKAEQGLVDGSFSLADVDYHLGGYSAVRYSIHRFNPKKADETLEKLFEDAAAEYPEAALSYMGLGYYYRYLNPERAVSSLEKALLLLEPTSDFYLASLQFMVEAYEKLGNKEESSRRAAQWLGLFEEFTGEYEVPAYYKNLSKKMRRIAQ